MDSCDSNKSLKVFIKDSYGLLLSLGIVFLLLLFRINSYKYSTDTSTIFDIFYSILSNHTTAIQGRNHFSYHFSPLLIFISPLYFLGPTGMIFVWKFFCYGLFLVILWRIINNENKLSNFHKNLFILLITLHPTFVSNLISPDIWDSDLTLPFLGISFLFLSKNKYFWSIFWFCLTFLIKEDMYLVGAFYGVLLSLHAKKIRFLWLSIFSFLLFWITTHFIMPYFSTSDEGLGLLKYSYGDMGNSLGEIIINIIREPSLILSSGLWLRKISSIMIIFLCVGFLPFLNKGSLLYLIPGLAILGYTLIAVQPFLDYSKHYVLVFFVFVVWASYNSYTLINIRYRTKVALFSAIVSIFVIVVLQVNIRNWSYYLYPIENIGTINSIEEKLIPPKAYMLTSGIGSPWVCYNKDCYYESSGFSPAGIDRMQYDYVLINLKTIFWEIINCDDTESMKFNLIKLNSNNKYQVSYYGNDVVLLKKKNSYDVDSVQPDWSEHLEDYEKINHDCMKSKLMRTLRFF